MDALHSRTVRGGLPAGYYLVTQVGPTGMHQLIGTNGIGAPMHHVTGPTTPMGGGGGGGGAATHELLPGSQT